jgi:hypothetical protein
LFIAITTQPGISIATLVDKRHPHSPLYYLACDFLVARAAVPAAEFAGTIDAAMQSILRNPQDAGIFILKIPRSHLA